MNLLKKVNFNISFLFILLAAFVTGLFKEIIIFASIIIVHEIGHLLIGMLFKKEVESVSFYIFGGYIKFKGYVNTSFFEDFMIGIGGFLSQFTYYLLMVLFYKLNIITYVYFSLFQNYCMGIFLFNLIPIYPLDGAVFMELIFMKLLPFKTAHKLVLYASVFIAFVVFFLSIYYSLAINYLLIIVLIIKQIYVEYKDHDLIFNKFLLERLLYDFKFRKKHIFKHNKFTKMYKGRSHTFKDKYIYRSEKQMLKKKFDFKR